MSNQFSKLMEWTARLDEAKIHYSMDKIREDSLLVSIAVPGERWEVEFFVSGSVEIEVFKSSGDIMDEAFLEDLFEKFSD